MANVCPGTAPIANEPVTVHIGTTVTPNVPQPIYSNNGTSTDTEVDWTPTDEFCSFGFTVTPGNQFIVPSQMWNTQWQNPDSSVGNDAGANPAIPAGFGVAVGAQVTGPATSGPIVIGTNTVTFTVVSGTIRVGMPNGSLFGYLPGDPVSNAVIKVDWASPVHGLKHVFFDNGNNQTPTGITNYQTSSPVPTSAVCNPATGVTSTGATLNSTLLVNPGDQVRYRYGTTPGGPYGTTLGPVPATDGANSIPVAGLAPSTQYYFIVEVLDAGNVLQATSGECTFTTTAAPVTATAQCDPATAITFNSATLNGTLGGISAGDQYQFRYGTTPGGPYGTTLGPFPAANGAVSQPVIALAPSTNYYFIVEVLNAGNVVIAASGQCTFATVAAPPGPTASGTPATGITDTSANANGTITAPPAGGFWEIHVGPSGGPYTTVACPNTPVSGADPQNVSCPLTGLAPSTQYCYLVVLKDSGLTIVATSPTQVCFTTAAAPVRTAVATPATAVTTNSATLNGTVGGIQPGDTYEFHYGTTPGGPYGTTVGPFPAANGPVSQPAAGLNPATPYYYVLVVKDSGAAVKATSNESSFVTQALPIIVDPCEAATAVTPVSATLHATADNVPAGYSYRFRYGTTPGGPYPFTVSGGPSSGGTPDPYQANVVGLTPGTTYYYTSEVLNPAQQVVAGGGECTFATVGAIGPGGFVQWCGALYDSAQCVFVPGADGGYWNCEGQDSIDGA